MKLEQKPLNETSRVKVINLLLSFSSGVAAFRFVNDIFKKTYKKGGIFTKTGCYVISSLVGFKTYREINRLIKEVMLWEKLTLLI